MKNNNFKSSHSRSLFSGEAIAEALTIKPSSKNVTFDGTTESKQKVLDEVDKDNPLIGELTMLYVEENYIIKSAINLNNKPKKMVFIIDIADYIQGTALLSEVPTLKITPPHCDVEGRPVDIPFDIDEGAYRLLGTLRFTPKISGGSIVIEIEEPKPPKSRKGRIKKGLSRVEEDEEVTVWAKTRQYKLKPME